jgi:insulysin
LAAEPLDELAGLASTLFSPVKNRGQDPAPMINEHPFGPNEKGVSLSFIRKLDIGAHQV